MAADVEFLIVGQGLAGTALAWELLRRGREALVIDADEPVTSSKVAAGLITPITGQRLALSWRVEQTLQAMREFYPAVASTLGITHFHPRPILRLFRSAEEAARWRQRTESSAFGPFMGKLFPGPGEFGSGEIRGGGYLDCAHYLRASREFFQRRGAFAVRRIDYREAIDFPARRVVFCEGFAAAGNPWFSWVPWKAAKGEMLTLKINKLAGEDRILTAGQWLAPIGEGVFRTGSTYEWNELDNIPTAAARAVLEKGLTRLTSHPYDVLDHVAAVRPIINESKALIGVHPALPKFVFFNGLGSKGALHAPFFARMLAAHLVDGTRLDEECDLQKNS